MTTRDQHIAHKKKEIEKISKQQVSLIKKAASVMSQPYKRPSTLWRRLGKMMVITSQIRALEMQKQMIIAQPIPNYVPGGVVPAGPAIVGEGGKEVIMTSKGNVFIPVDEMVHLPIQKD